MIKQQTGEEAKNFSPWDICYKETLANDIKEKLLDLQRILLTSTMLADITKKNVIEKS